jgi:hypothetical protein
MNWSRARSDFGYLLQPICLRFSNLSMSLRATSKMQITHQTGPPRVLSLNHQGTKLQEAPSFRSSIICSSLIRLALL